MDAPTEVLIEDQPVESFVISHGGDRPKRAAVLDDDGVVTSVALVPADWAEQDLATRWQPDGDVVLLEVTDEALAVPGARRVDGAWVAPGPQSAVEPAVQPVADPSPLGALVDALRALTPAQAAQLQQLLAVDPPAVT